MGEIANLLASQKDTLGEEGQVSLIKLINKLGTFSHAPLNKQHVLRMKPFIESNEVTGLIANVVRTYELKLMPNSQFSDYDIIGYYYCIALLSCCIVFEQGNFERIYSVLENEVVKENAQNSLVAERGGTNYNVMSRIFNFFKKDTNKFDKLITELKLY